MVLFFAQIRAKGEMVLLNSTTSREGERACFGFAQIRARGDGSPKAHDDIYRHFSCPRPEVYTYGGRGGRGRGRRHSYL